MLDLVSVAGQLRRMRDDLSSLADQTGPRLTEALSAWDRAAEMGPALADRVRRARTSWLVAEPLEPLRPYDVPPTDRYRVVATDGSQVMPDRHEGAHCFLLNVGVADIDYTAPAARLSSHPQVAWLPDDLYPTIGGVRQEADGRVVAARRFAAECDALASRAPGADLLLTDGTLLLWWLDTDPDRLRALPPHDVKAATLTALRRLLATARGQGCLVSGYLSSPRATDVVSMLKVVMCTEDPVDCDRCPYDAGRKTWIPLHPVRGRALLPEPAKPCEEAETLPDAVVLGSLLAPGQRSPRFRSAATVTAAYDEPIDLVYLHAGAEIARLEFPAWTTPDGLDRLCATVLDQCRKGMGYPVSLAEAHEQAVVRAADRRAFLDLVRRGGSGAPSAKLARKRVGVL
ncbi:MAG TPA: DNA double-strand break repair nuclease NurA [Actinomycetota bacterium]|nr:DNA double-strand break repair nuclease NurA [Actinomycetota bacterium]